MPKRSASKIHRSGFTLVELLVVVGIVAILAALAIPAVMRAIKTAQAAAVKLEVDMLSQSIEDYRTKYGEYPPDGTNWTEFQRHCRKAFPGILTTELALFDPTSTTMGADGTVEVVNDSLGRVMEPGEALVFFLGGMSNDPQRPFTGPGGPLVETVPSSGIYHYNVARQNGLFEFDSTRLTTQGTTLTASNDESTYEQGTNDLLPVYKQKYTETPYAYFNSRTYEFAHSGQTLMTDPAPLVARYASPVWGVAVPYVSAEINTASGKTIEIDPVTTAAGKPRFFANKSSFQIVSAGLDGQFTEPSLASVVPNKSNIQVFPVKIATKSSDVTYDNTVNFVDVSSIGDAARKVEANN